MIEMKDDGASPCADVLTLRDYFASAAMQGMVSNPVLLENGEFSDENIRMAYEVANAMLEARKL
jgi:hypothetical protein